MDNKCISQSIAKLQTVIRDTQLTQNERIALYNQLSSLASEVVNIDHPCLNVQLVPSDQVIDNEYNPNHVAPPEYKLLQQSIHKDGLTMPVVVGEDKTNPDNYVIIDGYHRSKLMKQNLTLISSLHGHIPVVRLDKKVEERMASSVRHNLARGSHQVELTAQLVIKLKALKLTDDDISRELGMDKDEVLRMQQVTGLAEAFKEHQFSTAWE